MAHKIYVNGEEEKKNHRLVDLTEHIHVGDINKIMKAARQRVRKGKSAKVHNKDRGKLNLHK